MRTFRWLIIVSTLVASFAVAPAAIAAGRAPMGNSLFSLTAQDDIVITDLVCDDETVTEVHVGRGGLAAWVLGEPDRMYVLASIYGESTVTTPEGSTTFTFGQSYGRKAGLDGQVSCSMNYRLAYGDVLEVGEMHVTVVRVW